MLNANCDRKRVGKESQRDTKLLIHTYPCRVSFRTSKSPAVLLQVQSRCWSQSHGRGLKSKHNLLQSVSRAVPKFIRDTYIIYTVWNISRARRAGRQLYTLTTLINIRAQQITVIELVRTINFKHSITQHSINGKYNEEARINNAIQITQSVMFFSPVE